MNEEQFNALEQRAEQDEKITRQEFENALEYILFDGVEEMPMITSHDWISSIRTLYRATE